MSWARALVFNVMFFAWTAAIGTLALPLLLAPRRASAWFGRLWSKSVLALLGAVVGLEYEVRGRDRLPRGACLVAMKHQSAWDAVVVPVVLADPAIVVKRELLYVPIYGWYAGRAGSIGIDRKGGGAALRRMVAAARRVAAQGRPIVIFPQGTRVAPGTQLPYQPGVAALYQALGVPLVPAAVNSGLFWGRRSFMKRRGRIVLEFLSPIPPGRPGRELMTELVARIESATDALLDEGNAARRRGCDAVPPDA
jgi:1-acyl-sn-glycerol-3-phosphate acyltransferase